MPMTQASEQRPTPQLTIWTAISLVIGCAIGSGVFVKPGKVLLAAGTSNGALLAWVLAGVMSLAGGLTIAEIAFRIPRTGGVYTYFGEIYGKTAGFMNGWIQILIYGPGLMAALSAYFGVLFVQFWNLPDSYQVPVALIALYFLALVNATSVRGSARISEITTALKLLPIAIIGIAGIFMGGEPIFGVSLPESMPKGAGMGAAVLACLWAYDGWMNVANIAGEIKNPARNLPRAIVIGIFTIMGAYLLVNLSLFHVLDKGLIATLNAKAAGAASEQLFGPVGGKLISLGILVSIFGCLNGNILTVTRIPYAVACNGPFPFREQFARLHPRFQTPVFSVILKAFIATVMVLLMNPDRITDLAMFSMYLFYGFTFIGIFKIRKRFGIPGAGEYRIPFYPVVPLVAVAGCGYIVWGMLQQAPMDAAVSVGIALLGIPVYHWLSRGEVKSL